MYVLRDSFCKQFADKLPCPECNVYYHKSSLQRHIRNQHGYNKAVECNTCRKNFKNEEILKDHMRRQHNTYQTSSF